MQTLARQLGKFFDHAGEEQRRQERNENARYRRRARKLAEQHGIELEVDILHDGLRQEWTCWICDPRFEGDAFCTSWQEVCEKLESLADG